MSNEYTPNNNEGTNYDSSLPNYQGDNQQYTQPPQKGKGSGRFLSRFLIRIIAVAVFAGLFYGGSVLMNKTSLFAKTQEIDGVSIELPRGYGALDANTFQSGKDDDSFSDDNVSIYVMDNELSLSSKEFVYGYISYISDDNLEIIDDGDVAIDTEVGYYMEYGTNATWYYDDGTSIDAYCSGIVMAVPNDDCMVVIDLYTRRGENSRDLLSDSEIDRFMNIADTIVLGDDIRSDIASTTVPFGTKSLLMPESYSTYSPESEASDFGTNYYLFADDGYKYVDFYDYTLSPLTEEEKQSYIDSFTGYLVEPATDKGDYKLLKYYNNSGTTYAGVSVVYDEFILDYYWICIDEPSQETFDKAIEILSTVK